jgi:hypothetical protein
MPLANGVSSSARAASPRQQAKKRSTAGLDSRWRTTSRFRVGASAICRPFAEQRREHAHAQLRVVGTEPLRLLTDDAVLELAALLQHLQVQLAIVLALGRESLIFRA